MKNFFLVFLLLTGLNVNAIKTIPLAEYASCEEAAKSYVEKNFDLEAFNKHMMRALGDTIVSMTPNIVTNINQIYFAQKELYRYTESDKMNNYNGDDDNIYLSTELDLTGIIHQVHIETPFKFLFGDSHLRPIPVISKVEVSNSIYDLLGNQIDDVKCDITFSKFYFSDFRVLNANTDRTIISLNLNGYIELNIKFIHVNLGDFIK